MSADAKGENVLLFHVKLHDLTPLHRVKEPVDLIWFGLNVFSPPQWHIPNMKWIFILLYFFIIERPDSLVPLAHL